MRASPVLALKPSTGVQTTQYSEETACFLFCERTNTLISSAEPQILESYRCILVTRERESSAMTLEVTSNYTPVLSVNHVFAQFKSRKNKT